MDAHLLLDLAAGERVALAEPAVGLRQELRHDEERDALDPCRGAGDARQHQVDDVLGQVVLAGGDEDLLPGDAVAAVALRLGAGAQQPEVGAAVRLGQVHRARPRAGDELRQVRRLLLRRAVRVDGVVGAVRQAPVHVERHVGGGVHLADGGVQHVRHALAAEVGVEVEPDPAALRHRRRRPRGSPRGVRTTPFSSRQPSRSPTAFKRRQHLGGDLARLLEDRGGEAAVELGVAGDRRSPAPRARRAARSRGRGAAERRRSWSVPPGPAARRGAAAGEHLLGPTCSCVAEVGDGQVELVALRLHRPQPLAPELAGAGDLGDLLVADVVEVQELADVLEREAEALALQDQLQPRPAAPGVEPLRAPRASGASSSLAS